MATYRTALALDRTTLAWVRTTLGMASFGFCGVALILLGIVASMLAGLSHWSAPGRLRRGEAPVLTMWPMSITVAMLSAIIGLAGLTELFAR